MHVLDTDRLRLRWLAASDAAFVRELVNEPAWLQFIGDRGVRTDADALAYLERSSLKMYALHGFSLNAVERKSDGALVGICGLLKRDTLEDVDLGFAFLTRFHGFGYAREAAAAVMHGQRAALGLHRVVAVTAPENLRSIRLLESLGFRFERMIRFAGGNADSKLFAWAAEMK